MSCCQVMAAEAEGRPRWNAIAFVAACEAGDLARVRALTSPEHMAANSRVDLNWRRDGDATGLYWACDEGHIDVVRYLTSPAMLAAGIDVNKGDAFDDSPLVIAATRGFVQIVRHLLESPELVATGILVNVNAAGSHQDTPLHRACYSTRSTSPEVVSLLLRHPHIDVQARNKEGFTALQEAAANAMPGAHRAEKVELIRNAISVPWARRYVLLVAMWSRREGAHVAAAPAAGGAGAASVVVVADATPAVPAGTLDEEDEKARGRRRLMGSLPPHLLMNVYALAGGL